MTKNCSNFDIWYYFLVSQVLLQIRWRPRFDSGKYRCMSICMSKLILIRTQYSIKMLIRCWNFWTVNPFHVRPVTKQSSDTKSFQFSANSNFKVFSYSNTHTHTQRDVYTWTDTSSIWQQRTIGRNTPERGNRASRVQSTNIELPSKKTCSQQSACFPIRENRPVTVLSLIYVLEEYNYSSEVVEDTLRIQENAIYRILFQLDSIL